MDNTVKTFDGTIVPRKKCRFIKGEYYEINKQCFFIEDKWYRINSGYIVFNHTSESWVLKETANLVKGVIGYDHMDKTIILGHFIKDPLRNVNVSINQQTYLALNYKILPTKYFFESKKTNTFYPLSEYSETHDKLPTMGFNNHDYPISLPYNFKKFDPKLIKITEEETFASIAQINKFETNIADAVVAHIGSFSFGFEFETNNGRIPLHRLFESGLVPLRDGSIRGIEYVTIPLSGSDGVKILEKATATLRNYTTITDQESLHLHLGNLPKVHYKDFIARLFTISCILEPEIYKMFPKYYNKTSLFKERRKDYNMPLSRALASLDNTTCFNNLAMYLSESGEFNGLGTPHPNNASEEHKWAINTRYHWLNLVPAIFGDNRTVEFRVHVPTCNPVKVLNWLAICVSILKYASENKNAEISAAELKGITLKKVLMDTIKDRAYLNYLLNYIEWRNKNSYENDSTGSREIASDMKKQLDMSLAINNQFSARF